MFGPSPEKNWNKSLYFLKATWKYLCILFFSWTCLGLLVKPGTICLKSLALSRRAWRAAMENKDTIWVSDSFSDKWKHAKTIYRRRSSKCEKRSQGEGIYSDMRTQQDPKGRGKGGSMVVECNVIWIIPLDNCVTKVLQWSEDNACYQVCEDVFYAIVHTNRAWVE